jgi:UDP-2,4-diacetamido-2,4,6-trideoxy-beta-L-altropyranose hydrolase
MKTLKKESKILVFRVDASTQMGTGHVMRCLALAQAWQTDGGEVYFCTHQNFPIALTQRLSTEGMTRIEIQATPGSLADALATIAHCQECNSRWLILDGYHFDADYQQLIKAAGLQLLVIDDYGHADSYCADFVLNQNVYACANFYPRLSPHTQLLLGCDYVLLRREFWKWRDWQREIVPTARKIVVTLGGADPDNATLTVMHALSSIDSLNLNVTVVIGSSNPHLSKLFAFNNGAQVSMKLLSNVIDMPELMANADAAIVAGGSTVWELCFLGLPFITIAVAENQVVNCLELNRLKVAPYLGWYHNINPSQIASTLKDLLLDVQLRKQMSLKGKTLINGDGSQNVLSKMVNFDLN